MFKRKRTVLGLDIGSQSIKLVELTLEKEGIALTNYGIISLPPAEEAKKTALIITGIREMLRSKEIRTKKVVFSLKERDVIMRFLRLPLMPEKELKEVLRQEVFRISHLPREEINWDYLLFPGEEEKEELGAIIILSERKAVAQFTSLIQQIPLKPLSISVTALALWETISKLEYKEKETLLSLHIDEEITTIMLLTGRNLSFVRKIYVATATFLEDVAKKLDLSREEIENLKGELKRGMLSTSVEEVIKPWLERLANEVARSLEYYRTELKVTEAIKPDRLFLSGPGSQWKGVKDFFAERLGVKAESFDLFRILKVDPVLFDMRQLREASPLLTVATGLSLSQLAPTMAQLQPKWRVKRRINLLPREIKKIILLFRLLFRVVVPALGLFLFFLLSFTMMVNLHYRGEVKEKKRVLDKLEGIITTAKNEGIGGESAFIRKALGERVEWSAVLGELSRITPGQVWLTGLSYGKEEGKKTAEKQEIKEKPSERLKIEGFSHSNSSIVEFVSRLQNSPLFSDVQLENFQKDSFQEKEVVKFILTSELRRGL